MSPENTTLQPSTPQQDAVRARLARSLETAVPAPGVEFTLRDLWFGSLSTVCGPEVCGGGELVAGVLSHFDGPLPTLGLFAMDPEDALTALRTGFGELEPLGAFVSVGSRALLALATGLSEGLGPIRQEGPATLEEDSVIGTLLRTHAPSDTTVVSVGLDLRVREASIPAYVYLLVEPKFFSGLLASVAHP